MKYNLYYPPEFITSLQPSEILVFGSNIRGQHGAGAARIAHLKFVAEWGLKLTIQKKENLESAQSYDIRKHRDDVFKLLSAVVPTQSLCLRA